MANIEKNKERYSVRSQIQEDDILVSILVQRPGTTHNPLTLSRIKIAASILLDELLKGDETGQK